jgi:outer membrane biosynthesis protein TonB
MKRAAVLPLSLALAWALTVPSPALAQGGPDKGPVFTIKITQNGDLDGMSFETFLEAGYSPCSSWNSGRFGGLTASGGSVFGAMTAGTPGALLAERGDIAGMRPGELLQLFLSRKTGSASDSGGTSGTVETLGPGYFRCTIGSGQDAHYSDNGRDQSSNPAMGPAAHADAEILRTEDGAVLRLGLPYTGVEGYGDHFGIFEGDNQAEGLPEVLTFKFTREELKNWSSLQKTNARTLSGPLGGALKIRVEFRGGTLSGGADVALDGCFDVGEGGQGQVTASGKPAGGSYRFRVVPPEAMTVQASGATATLTGGAPNQGTLFVEYTSPDGKTAEASHAVASVKIESVNGGAPVPEIPLYDIDQKKLPAVIEVPFKAMPADAAAGIVFEPQDPSIVTLVNLGNAVAVQGLREGKTTFQARLKCGGPFGPVVEVEVVRCSKETVARLEQDLRDAFEARRTAAKDFSKAMGSKEFQEAADKIAGSTLKLARKTSLLIAGTVSGYGEATGAVKAVSEIAGRLDAVGEVIQGIVTYAEAGEQIKSWVGVIAEFSEKQLAQTVWGTFETLEAATEFGKQLGDLKGQTERMAEAAKWMEHWNKAIEDIVKRQRFCRKTEQPPQEQKPPKEQEPPRPKPKTDPTKPAPPTTPPGETPPVPPGGETPPPQPPPGPPRTVGLPYEPGDCGCDKEMAVRQDPNGFASISMGFGNMLDCVDRFKKDVEGYAVTLQEMTAVFGKLDAATKAGGATLKNAAKEAAPAIAAFSTKVKAFGSAGAAFDKSFHACPESMKAGVSFLQSAKDYAKSAETKGAIGVRK